MAGGRVGDAQAAVVGVGDLAGDRQAQSGARRVAPTGVATAVEAAEDRLTFGGGDPWSVIDDLQERLAAVCGDRHLDPGAGVAFGVGQQVGQQTRQPERGTVHGNASAQVGHDGD
jgi:hypothetical protein